MSNNASNGSGGDDEEGLNLWPQDQDLRWKQESEA